MDCYTDSICIMCRKEIMKDVINLAVVNFRTLWGKKEKNAERMAGYVEAAARMGANMVVFPEMALTGYDDEPEVEKALKMQTLQAETIPGKCTEIVKQIAVKYGVYVLFGMPECIDEKREIIYNSIAILTPEGKTMHYRKLHLPLSEPNWATRGDDIVLLDTPWGKIGMGICYDVYKFPELIRYAAAKGARLFINCTAFGGTKVSGKLLRSELENDVTMNQVFLASSNLTGMDRYSLFPGCSHILGPTGKEGEVQYYAGEPLDSTKGSTPGIIMAALDLSIATENTTYPLFSENNITGYPDLRPDLYKKWYEEIIEDEEWKALSK